VTGNANQPGDAVAGGGAHGGLIAPTPRPQPRRAAWSERLRHPNRSAIIFSYLVIVIAGLIALRATVDSLNFIGIGWLIVLALIPLLPWALPRIGGFLKSISPYVSRFSVGAVQLELRAVTDAPITVPTSGALASLANDLGVLSSGTGIGNVITSLRTLSLAGGAPIGIIDLQKGDKWRLPNLYFLSIMLELDPIVTQFVLTEVRGGIDGYVVRTCKPGELRRQIELALPAYSAAAGAVQLPAGRDLTNPVIAQELGNAFMNFQNSLGMNSGATNDPLFGYVNADRINELVVSPADPLIESPGSTLSEEVLRTTLVAVDRFVPTTANGRLTGLIDRDAVALVVARSAVSRAAVR
jgi:hypothetical protein